MKVKVRGVSQYTCQYTIICVLILIECELWKYLQIIEWEFVQIAASSPLLCSGAGVLMPAVCGCLPPEETVSLRDFLPSAPVQCQWAANTAVLCALRFILPKVTSKRNKETRKELLGHNIFLINF